MEPHDAGVRKRFVEQHGTVVYQEFCGHAVRAVNKKIVGGKDIREIAGM